MAPATREAGTLAAEATFVIKVARYCTCDALDAIASIIDADIDDARAVIEFTCADPEPSVSERLASGGTFMLKTIWKPLKPASAAAVTEAVGVMSAEGVALVPICN